MKRAAPGLQCDWHKSKRFIEFIRHSIECESISITETADIWGVTPELIKRTIRKNKIDNTNRPDGGTWRLRRLANQFDDDVVEKELPHMLIDDAIVEYGELLMDMENHG